MGPGVLGIVESGNTISGAVAEKGIHAL